MCAPRNHHQQKQNQHVFAAYRVLCCCVALAISFFLASFLYLSRLIRRWAGRGDDIDAYSSVACLENTYILKWHSLMSMVFGAVGNNYIEHDFFGACGSRNEIENEIFLVSHFGQGLLKKLYFNLY